MTCTIFCHQYILHLWDNKVALCWIAWLRGCVPTVEQPRNSHLVYHPGFQWWIQWLSHVQASHKFGHLAGFIQHVTSWPLGSGACISSVWTGFSFSHTLGMCALKQHDFDLGTFGAPTQKPIWIYSPYEVALEFPRHIVHTVPSETEIHPTAITQFGYSSVILSL